MELPDSYYSYSENNPNTYISDIHTTYHTDSEISDTQSDDNDNELLKYDDQNVKSTGMREGYNYHWNEEFQVGEVNFIFFFVFYNGEVNLIFFFFFFL